MAEADNKAVGYRWIEDVEYLERYHPGGYHPVSIGEMLAGRYQIIDKLGYGGYSTIWLARDHQRSAYVAVKITTADSNPRESEILRALAKTGIPGHELIPLIEDHFSVEGPNGRHGCYVTSPAGSNLTDAQDLDCFSIPTARVLIAQLIIAVAYIHSRGYVHGDIHTGNVLLRLQSNFDGLTVEDVYERFGQPYKEPIFRTDGKPLSPNVPSFAIVPTWIGRHAEKILPNEGRLYLSDFGKAFSVTTEHRVGGDCHSPLEFRPPETIFEPESPIGYPSDIWSLACTLWPILGAPGLFCSFFCDQDDVISQHIDVLGYPSFPSVWWDKWEARSKYFESGEPKGSRSTYPTLENAFDNKLQFWRRKRKMGEYDQEEKAAFIAMVRTMLVFRPEERATTQALLASKWMVNWGLPELKKQAIFNTDR